MQACFFLLFPLRGLRTYMPWSDVFIPGVVRLTTFVVVVCLLAHYCACIFFYIGEAWVDNGDETISWTTATYFVQKSDEWTDSGIRSVHDLESRFSQYVCALYWAVTTMTTTGYGDITPKTTPEIAFATVVIIMGGITYSFIIGNLANLL